MTDWPVKTLEALCDEGVVLLGRGNIISKKDIAANPGPYPIYSSAQENQGKFGEYGDFMFDEEMITWSIDGGGRLFYRPKHKFSVTNVGGTLRVLNPKVLEIRYLHRALENLHSQKVFDWVFKAHPSVIRKVYDEIPVPPLEEQKRIVALLDVATEHVTELTVCYEKARTHANNLFASALRDALENNPDWPVKTLGDLCDIYQPQTIGTKDLIADGKYIVYGANGPIGRYDRFNHEKSEVTVTCRGATCGTVNVTPPEVWITGNAMVVRPNDMEMSKEMMRYVLEGLDYSQIITGAAQPQITRQTLAPSTVQVPPLEEQMQIVARLDLMRAKTSEMVAAYDAKLTAAKNLRQSILEAAFAGEL
jgi:type I restriction enzyme S subunit